MVGGAIPNWNGAGLSLPDCRGFIGRRRGQKIQVISFFMHGFCPHGNISKERRSGRGRERERTDQTGKIQKKLVGRSVVVEREEIIERVRGGEGIAVSREMSKGVERGAK